VMKMAVAHLEPHMEKVEGSTKGKIVLATVKGDVHDIGKNLVDIILTNNGYEVHNLGIKVAVTEMIEKALEVDADAIGMSGLLVKSTLVMKENLQIMTDRGIEIPVVLGGAALNRKYVEGDLREIYGDKLAYAKDAFDGLHFMDRLKEGGPIEPEPKTRKTDSFRKSSEGEDGLPPTSDDSVRSSVERSMAIPRTPFLGSRVVANVPLDKIFEYINEVALFRGQWGARRGRRSNDEYEKELEDIIRPKFEELKLEAKRKSLLHPQVVYGYFPCKSDGNRLRVFRPESLSGDELNAEWPDEYVRQLNSGGDVSGLVPWETFDFPRQRKRDRFCLADFFRSIDEDGFDIVPFFIVTVGRRASEETARLFESGDYSDYLFFHGLSVETAEAFAEYWHRSIRRELNIADDDAEDLKKLFSQGYRGSRYSFGYPACPNLEDHEQLFRILQPDRIGVELTDEWMLDPEQSTSAIVVHHPEAKYFNV